MINFKRLFQKTSPYKLQEEKTIQKIGLISISVSLIIIFLTMSSFVLYTKQKRQKELISNGSTFTSMVASYSENDLKANNANELLKIVNYAGSKNGLVYGMIMDTNQRIIGHTDISYVDNMLIAKKATSSNNPLKQIYKDSITNHTIYEFSRPIYINGNKEGTVRLGFSPDINPLFSDSDIRGLLLVSTLFFSLVPIFYYVVRRSLQLQILSITDELTGLYNRRGFFTLAESRLHLAKRSKEMMLLLYADLDNLKEINDTLGHEEGDRFIKETANILKLTCRKSDIIARLGGDEFVVFPVGTDKERGKIISGRLQKNIDDFNAKENNRYKLKLSTGMAIYDPNSEQSLDELLAQADELMYKIKKSKRMDHKRESLNVKGFYCPG